MKELNIRLGTAFILVFDLQNVKTLKSLVELRQLIVNIKGCEDVPLVLVGNKSDLVNPHDIVHMEEEFNNVLSSFKCVYIETSAKKNTNVSDIFKVIVQLVVKDMEEDFNESEYRRNSSISFVRSLTIGKKKQSEKSRRFSEPAVVTKSKHKSKASSAKESGKSTPSFRKKQKNCTIS
jgi:GTPase SAR1 family protein